MKFLSFLCTKWMGNCEAMTSSTRSFACSYQLVKKCFLKICETSKGHNFLIFQPIFIRFSLFYSQIVTLSYEIQLNVFRISPLNMVMILLDPPADPGIWERGGITYCFFRTAASLETCASPKKADKRGGGGGLRHFFFSERHLRRGGVSSNRGLAGRNQTPFFFFFFFFFLGFKRGGTCTKRGGAFIHKCFKRGGTGRLCPPPKSATGWICLYGYGIFKTTLLDITSQLIQKILKSISTVTRIQGTGAAALNGHILEKNKIQANPLEFRATNIQVEPFFFSFFFAFQTLATCITRIWSSVVDIWS